MCRMNARMPITAARMASVLLAPGSDPPGDGVALSVCDLDTPIAETLDGDANLLLGTETRILHKLIPEIPVQHVLEVGKFDILTAALAHGRISLLHRLNLHRSSLGGLTRCFGSLARLLLLHPSPSCVEPCIPLLFGFRLHLPPLLVEPRVPLLFGLFFALQCLLDKRQPMQRR